MKKLTRTGVLLLIGCFLLGFSYVQASPEEQEDAVFFEPLSPDIDLTTVDPTNPDVDIPPDPENPDRENLVPFASFVNSLSDDTNLLIEECRLIVNSLEELANCLRAQYNPDLNGEPTVDVLDQNGGSSTIEPIGSSSAPESSSAAAFSSVNNNISDKIVRVRVPKAGAGNNATVDNADDMANLFAALISNSRVDLLDETSDSWDWAVEPSPEILDIVPAEQIAEFIRQYLESIGYNGVTAWCDHTADLAQASCPTNDPLHFDQNNCPNLTPNPNRRGVPYAYRTRETKMDKAWVSTANPRAIQRIEVGYCDTGVDYNHEDLLNNLALNQGELPSAFVTRADTNRDGYVDFSEALTAVGDLDRNGKVEGSDLFHSRSPLQNSNDQDRNGLTDDFLGWDYANNDNNPLDTNGHGTKSIGLLGMTGNNAKGMAGDLHGFAKITPVKVANSGQASNARTIQCINYLRQRIKNIVLGHNPTKDTALTTAVNNHMNPGNRTLTLPTGNTGARVASNKLSEHRMDIRTIANTDAQDNWLSSTAYAPSLKLLGVAVPAQYLYTSDKTTSNARNTYADFTGSSGAPSQLFALVGAMENRWNHLRSTNTRLGPSNAFMNNILIAWSSLRRHNGTKDINDEKYGRGDLDAENALRYMTAYAAATRPIDIDITGAFFQTDPQNSNRWKVDVRLDSLLHAPTAAYNVFLDGYNGNTWVPITSGSFPIFPAFAWGSICKATVYVNKSGANSIPNLQKVRFRVNPRTNPDIEPRNNLISYP